MSETNRHLPEFPGTTCIGSLPHHNIDAALAFSFQTQIPFLPQIPIRNPWEYMIAQALEGMPGLMVDAEGSAQLDLGVWTGRSHAFNERLLAAFSSTARPDAFEAFEPSNAASSSWQPFLWELEERKIHLAKIQLAGPLTAQWVLQLKDGTPADRHPEIGDQVFRLVLARALGMARRLQAGNIQPILFLDEPGLYGLSQANTRHLMGLQQLRVVAQALRKEGVIVGLHCCSNGDWAQILGLGFDVLSIDAELSLSSLLEQRDEVLSFVERGGVLSLGVVPTSPGTRTESWEGKRLLADLLETFTRAWPGDEASAQRVLRQAIFTPACGLGLHSIQDAETILATLLEFERELRTVLR